MEKQKTTYFRPEIDDQLERPLDLLQFLTGDTKRHIATEGLKQHLIKKFDELRNENNTSGELARKWHAFILNDFKEPAEATV